MRSRARRNLATLLRLLVTGGVIAFLAATLDWRSIGRNLVRSDPGWLTLAELLAGASIVLTSARWWLLLKVQSIHVSFRSVNTLGFVSQFFNLFLLGSLGGDAAKFLLVAQQAPLQKTRAAVSLLMDRAMGLGVVLCALLAVFPLQFESFRHTADGSTLYRGLLAVFVMLIGLLNALAFLPFDRIADARAGWLGRLARHRLLSLAIEGFREHRQAKRLTACALLLSFAVWWLIFAAAYAAGRAISLEASFFEVMTMVGVVVIAASLPISIAGHGIREGGFILMFSLLAIATPAGFHGQREAAVAFSLLFFALSAFWGLIGGLIFLSHRELHRHSSRHKPDQAR